MNFRIRGLPAQEFAHLIGLPDEQLAQHGARRQVVDRKPGFPDRIELRDGNIGETMLLLNYCHQPAATPFRSSHAIFVLEHPAQTYDRVDDIPEVMRSRMLSLRAFASDGMMLDADLVDGRQVEDLIGRLLSNPQVDYVHVHYAKPGCYAARIDRA
jgi:hypothetical protein